MASLNSSLIKAGTELDAAKEEAAKVESKLAGKLMILNVLSPVVAIAFAPVNSEVLELTLSDRSCPRTGSQGADATG